MPTITLIAPTGETRDFDSSADAQTINKFLGNGARVAAPAQSTNVAQPGQQQPNYNQQWAQDLPPSLARGATNLIPAAAAIGATALTGGADIPAGAGAMAILNSLYIPALTRLGLGGAGNLVGNMIRAPLAKAQGMDPGTPKDWVDQSGQGMLMAAPFEAGATGLAMMAPGAMRAALNAGKGAQRAAGTNMTATARAEFPEGSKLWSSFTKMKLPVSTDAVDNATQPVLARRTALISNAAQSGTTYGPDQIVQSLPVKKFLSDVGALRDKDAADAAYNLVDGFKSDNQGARWSAQELDDLKQARAARARGVYTSQAGPSGAPPAKGLADKFDAAVAQAARQKLEDDVPRLASTNATLQRLGRMRSAAADAQARNPGLIGHAGMGMGGGLATFGAMRGDPREVAAGLGAMGLSRVLSNPTLQSQLSLMASNPMMPRIMGAAPWAGMGAMGMMPQGAPADSSLLQFINAPQGAGR